MGRDLVRGARQLRRLRGPAARSRGRPARARGGRGRIRLRARRLPKSPRLRRLPAGRRDAVRGDHRPAASRRPGSRARPRCLRPLRAAALGACPVRGPEPAAPRVLPRPRARRVAALRRRPQAGGRRAAPRPLAARPRARAEARGRAEVRGVKIPAKTAPAIRMRPVAADDVDVRALEDDLRRTIEGEVRFSPGDRGLYSATGANYRQLPIGVVIPRTVDDVIATVAACREHGTPLLSRGGGTGLAGQTTNVAVVIDFSKYLNRILEIDAERKLARVEPGLILDHLRKQAEEEHRLTFGPDPSTHEYCTFGGMIASNSCGVRSVMSQFYGPGPRTSDNVHELDVLLYDGRRLTLREGTSGDPEIDRRLEELRDRYADQIRARYPDIPRRVSGYNLDDPLPEKGFHVARAAAGTESTCVTILGATVHLLDSPPARSLLVLAYGSVAEAGDGVMKVLEHKPLGLEGVDETLITDMTMLGKHKEDLSLLPDGRGWLLAEFGGETKDEADEKARALMQDLTPGKDGLTGMKLYDDPPAEQHVWEVRESGLGATAFIPGKPDTYEGWEDSAVPPERLCEYLRRLQKLAKRYDYERGLYGHYGNG